MATTLTCLKCGEAIRAADRFCSRCGDELTLGSYPASLIGSDAHDDDPESPWAEVVQRLRQATLGEFEIGRELGRGGMAAVFLGHEISLDRKVAIKVMSPGLLMGDGMIDRFKREAITIAHLNHPNIVSCYSVRQAEGLHFFVMRYIRGRSLEQLIHHAGRLPLPIVRSILCQVGSALTYAHRSRVVHRDIKPANILIDEDGNAVVTDFGIAKVAELPGQTHTGALVGTPAYMSPEQCDGGEVSGASDQYSLGAVAYEMVAGVPPFTGSTLTVMQAQVERIPRPIRELCPDCPPDFEAAVLRMLAKDPAERFANMAEAKAALGATPLMEDDPLLVELCRLATAGSSPPLGTPTPVSPTPYTRSSPAPRPSLAGQASSVVILPPPAELAVGDGFALVALVRGDHGVPLPGKTVEWESDAPDVLHIDATRKVATAVAPGAATLTARCDGIESRVRVLVPASVAEPFDSQDSDPPASIEISTPPKSIRVGDSFVLTAMLLDRAGRPLHYNSVLWNTSDVRIAVVTAEGWVAALGEGPVTLTAVRGDASGSVTLQVEPAVAASKPMRAPKPIRAPKHQVRPSEPTPPRRTGRRRRGASLRSALVKGTIGAAAVGAAVWLLGGLRDFRVDRGSPSAEVSDSGPSTPDSSPRMGAGDSAPPAEREPAASPGVKSRPRRAARPGPAVNGSVSIAPHEPVRAGETVTLTAVVLDGQNRPVTNPELTWASREPDLALVDSTTGKVLAKAPGTAHIVAQSGPDSAISELTVLPSPDGPPDTSGYAPLSPAHDQEELREEPARAPPAAQRRAPASGQPALAARVVPDPPVDRRKLESRMREGVGHCYDAVRSKKLDRLTDIYRPETVADEEKLRRLIRILRTEPWEAVVGKRVDGAREMGARAAAAEFSFRLTWRDALGGHLFSHPIFRAEFARDGDGWTMSSCRIVGSPKL